MASPCCTLFRLLFRFWLVEISPARNDFGGDARRLSLRLRRSREVPAAKATLLAADTSASATRHLTIE